MAGNTAAIAATRRNRRRPSCMIFSPDLRLADRKRFSHWPIHELLALNITDLGYALEIVFTYIIISGLQWCSHAGKRSHRHSDEAA
jgi:hypothetical protein